MGHSFPSLLIQILSISVLIILYVIVTVKHFIKHKHHLEPNHIYELSILSDFLAIFTTVFLQQIERKYQSWAPYCVLVNFVRISARLSLNADISASQVDRFLALYWNVEYKARVTARQAGARPPTSSDSEYHHINKVQRLSKLHKFVCQTFNVLSHNYS